LRTKTDTHPSVESSFDSGYKVEKAHGVGQAEPAVPSGSCRRRVRHVLGRTEGSYDPADVKARYEARLRELIEAKLKGEGLAPENIAAAGTSNVVDLMAALRRSVEQNAKEHGAAESSPAETGPVEQDSRKPGTQKAAASTTPTLPKKSARRRA
jgi:hypothetical protein